MRHFTIEIYRMPEGDWACSVLMPEGDWTRPVLCVICDGYLDPVEAARGAAQILEEHWPKARRRYWRNVMARRQPYVDAQWNPKAGECWICGRKTHWVEINYLAFICSAACLEEADRGYQAALKGGERK